MSLDVKNGMHRLNSESDMEWFARVYALQESRITELEASLDAMTARACGNLPPIPEREIMNIQTLAERFCSTPLPDSVCADPCATHQGPGRTGTNLLTIEEAKEVLERILPFNREMGRDDVYILIDGERDHQDAKWGEIEDHPHEVGSWILILEKLVQDARLAWVGKTRDKGALAEVRQIAAVAVACIEQHGAPSRQ